LFITISGLTGPVTTAGRAGTFVAQALDWGIAQPPPESGDKAPRRHEVVRLTKAADGASVPALESLLKNAPITATTLTVINDTLAADGKRPVIATFELTKPIVVRQSFAGSSGGGDRVAEMIELIYEQVTMQHNASGQKFSASFHA
jgi:type VI protein secretion system component Hcp